MKKILANLQRFANEHKIVLETKGECGFGRPCVGFLHGDNYVDYNPSRLGDSNSEYEEIFPEGFERDDRLRSPNSVPSYHKHDCLAVLAINENYDKALRGLNRWVKHLESQGEVEVVTYDTGATGFQAVVSGVMGRAIRFKKVTAK